MTREDLLALFDRTVTQCRATMEVKNHDYTCNSDGGPFANFLLSESIFNVPAEVGLMLRVLDKVQRIKTYINLGELQVQGEGFHDAVCDVINYMVLLRGIVQEKEQRKYGGISAD